ncbi:MAG: polyprenyl synthetase family protein [Candidatus Adiutrix sp.]|jgi:octaprenyl-diphosphate synthase|nr:polyprenyl synthetase family protein [Candidatus Adiutrix sp.]
MDSPRPDILADLAPLVARINAAIARLMARDDEIVAKVGDYCFDAGGKRIRPLLFCLMTQALLQPLTESRLETGASFEFLHMATLLHDDIVDAATLRRGRAAAHLVYGAPEAVLAGDYLLAKASLLGAATDNLECVKTMAGLVSTLSLGELVQLGARRQVELTEADYFQIIYRKTAVLMEGATRIAAVLAGADGPTLAAAAHYGRQFGLAFQIMDDILDYHGDQTTFGKPVGHDLDDGKITLPFILAREALDAPKRRRLGGLAGQDRLSPADHLAIGQLVAEGQGVNRARLKADELVRAAQTALTALPPSAARDQLTALAAFTLSRDH